MPPLFVWKGPETDIVNCCCVAVALEIECIENGKDGTKAAKGMVTVKDYVEGGTVFSDPWEAVGMPQPDGAFLWQVKRARDESTFFVDEAGEALFTVNSTINNGLKRFIGGKLNEYLTHGRCPGNVEEYTGPRDKYEGRCVCATLEDSNPLSPFDWEETTGGRFPQHCFACSCGTNWWCISPEESAWVPVPDDAAWEMLLSFNGVEVRKLALFEDGLYLLQTIRDRGFIPIPCNV